MAEDLLTTNVAGRAVGYSGRSLLRWAEQGKITPARRTPGGRLMWNLDDLKRQLAELERASSNDG